jgi:hypothetical protein
MRVLRNFTGNDLTIAETSMKDAYAVYLERKDRYDYSISQGHDGYAKRNHLKPMEEAWKAYEQAKTFYDDVVKSIEAANNVQFKAEQQNFVASSLQSETVGDIKPKDYTNYIYIGIAILAILFFWKQSKSN